MRENPYVRSVRFIKSAVAKRDWPDAMGLPEVAVAGRSNVGKSSLINRLVNRHRLARVSNTPGRTQLLNFFEVNGQFVLCDLPGYGYAKVPTAIREGWGPMIEGYLNIRTPLRVLMVLIDCRRDPGQWETSLVTYCSERGLTLLPVVTKMDKVSKSQKFPTLARIGKTLGLSADALIAFSAETGEGADLLWRRLMKALALEGPAEVADAPLTVSPPASELRLRPMTAEDAPEVAVLSADAGAARWDAEAFRRELALPHATLKVLMADGRLVGFIVWWRVVDELHLLNIVVEPGSRRRGFARRLMDDLMTAASAEPGGPGGHEPVRALELEVRAGNSPAIALYDAYGFELVGRRKRYYADGEDALLMERLVQR